MLYRKDAPELAGKEESSDFTQKMRRPIALIEDPRNRILMTPIPYIVENNRCLALLRAEGLAASESAWSLMAYAEMVSIKLYIRSCEIEPQWNDALMCEWDIASGLLSEATAIVKSIRPEHHHDCEVTRIRVRRLAGLSISPYDI